MLYTIDADVESPIMLIDKHIGFNESDGQGIDGSLFQRELLTLDGKSRKSIQCWLNTPGGNVYQGYMMVNSILNSKTPVDTYNIGMVASMGFPIFMAGRKRIMMDYAVAMIHNPFNPNKEDREETEDEKKVTEAMTESMVKMIASRSKISESKVRKMMAEETWLNADECLKYGFCTEIEHSSHANKKWMPSEYAGNMKAVWEQAKKMAANANNFLQENHIQMSNEIAKINTKLGLNEAASVDNSLDAIRNIESRAEKAEMKLIDQENKHKASLKDIQDKAATEMQAAVTAKEAAEKKAADLQASLDAKNKEFNDLKAKHDAMEKEKNEAIAAEKKTKAETLVASHVKVGRIKNEQPIIDKWVARAVDNYDEAKEMIEAIPLSKTAPVIVIEANKVEGIHATTSQMLAIKNRLKRQGKEIPA